MLVNMTYIGKQIDALSEPPMPRKPAKIEQGTP
ncbi:MAG: hypothetical protein QOD11_2920, partial [Bradyrhizobium sp.]|nr:hypothetical protein [Bradyrhizobium sp.]